MKVHKPMTRQDDAFRGTKLALICGESLITYLRDDKADIPFPGMWDFAGGERHGTEGPVECGLRELFEEFGLRIVPARVQALAGIRKPGATTLPVYFGVVHVTPDEIDSIRFGEEGQYWTLMSLHDYLRHPRAIPFLQECLADYLAGYLNVSHASSPQN
jgi:8-oxo-dGTP diphosphatase